jgi:hypothetical protein
MCSLTQIGERRLMSYDLQVWIADEPAAKSELAKAGFREADGENLLAAQGWTMIAVIRPVDDDEIPDAIYSQVVGITHRIDMMLTSAVPEAYAKFDRLARRLAEKGRGAVEGLAAEPWLSKSAKAALKTAAPPPSAGGPRRVSELVLSWWFDPAEFVGGDLLERLMAVIPRHLPEALPRRYNSYAPPGRFKLAETGLDHFIQYLRDQPYLADVDPTRPCLLAAYPHGNLYGWRTWANGDTGYVPCTLSFGFDSVVLQSPHWRRRLDRAWREISFVIRPFYGDVRLLDGLSVGRGGVGMFFDAQFHPAKGRFWIGIPHEPALARVIGDPYLALWTGLPLATDGLVFLGPLDWGLPHCDPTAVPTDISSFPLPQPPGQISPRPRVPARILPFAQPAR